MEEPREGDCRVPLISSLFCLCVAVGGVLLCIYVYRPSASKAWYPVAALLLIGSPWIFWVLTYIYTLIKACVRRHRLCDRQISRGNLRARSTANTNERDEQSANEPSTRSDQIDEDGKHVHFVGVVLHNGGTGKAHGGGAPETRDSSVNSSKEIEMPLTLSVSS